MKNSTPSEIIIGDKRIGQGHKPLVVAEMSGNHGQSLERALKIVDAAAAAGADALKIQTFTADTMTLNLNTADFYIQNDKANWDNTLYNLYTQTSTPWEWHKPLFDRCKKHGMEFFSTPFDDTAVDFLEKLGVPAYKIASFECNDKMLIKKVAQTGKPLIISTGMATISEIHEAVATVNETSNSNVVLLKCVSSYPTDPVDSNLKTIPHLSDTFKVQVGLSDHSLGIGVAVAATALGATVIEKHFTLARSDGGPDAAFSMEPDEFKQLTTEVHRAWQSLGEITYSRTKNELQSVKYRRSLYVVENIKKGEKFTNKNIRAIRPGYGLPTKFYDLVVGRAAKEDISIGTAVTWDLL